MRTVIIALAALLPLSAGTIVQGTINSGTANTHQKSGHNVLDVTLSGPEFALSISMTDLHGILHFGDYSASVDTPGPAAPTSLAGYWQGGYASTLSAGADISLSDFWLVRAGAVITSHLFVPEVPATYLAASEAAHLSTSPQRFKLQWTFSPQDCNPRVGTCSSQDKVRIEAHGTATGGYDVMTNANGETFVMGRTTNYTFHTGTWMYSIDDTPRPPPERRQHLGDSLTRPPQLTSETPEPSAAMLIGGGIAAIVLSLKTMPRLMTMAGRSQSGKPAL